jgi:basic membrane protein A
MRGTGSSRWGTVFLWGSAAAALTAAWGAGCARDHGDARAFTVFVITDAGGLGDHGKNDMVWRACQQLAEESVDVPVKVEYRAPASWPEGRSSLAEAARTGADVVVVASPGWEADALALARRYPRVAFIVVGGTRGGANVKALTYPLPDAGYLMGIAAAAAVPSGGYGFIGGREDEAARALAAGFAAGVAAERPGVPVGTAYLGRDFGAPAAHARARGISRKMFENGVAVIFAAAGPANVDIAATARECNRLVIGYESNQNYLERGYVLTSLNIRWDEVVLEELRAAAAGRFRGGVRRIPIGSEYITYPIDANNRALIPADAVRKIEAARQRLACGRVS